MKRYFTLHTEYLMLIIYTQSLLVQPSIQMIIPYFA